MSITPSKQQKKAIMAGDGPLLIIAGAGTGKTFTITQRIVHLIRSMDIDPEAILALTFTEKASLEMEDRVDQYLPLSSAQVPIKTFHSFCDQVLREDGMSIGIYPDFQLMTDTDQVFFLRKRIFSCELDILRPSGNPTKYIQVFVKHFSRLGDEDISPKKYEDYIRDEDLFDMEEKRKYLELSGLYTFYQQEKLKTGKLTFGDLIFYTLKLLRKNPKIKQKWQKRFKYVLIDEFQDTNLSQYLLVKELTDYSNEPNITVVADDDQSIYKFRGAAVSNVLQFTSDFPRAQRIVMTENRRSVQRILDASYKMIQSNNPDRLEIKEKIDKRLVAMGTDLVHYPSPVEFRAFVHSTDESEGIALEIKDLVSDKFKSLNAEYSDIAILVRANSHADEIILALSRHNIPFQFHGAKRLFNEEIVKNLMSFLRVVTDYKDNISMNGLLTMDIWGINERELIEINMRAHKLNISIFELLDNSEIEHQKTEELINLVKTAWKMIRDKKSIWDILYKFIHESSYLKDLTESDIKRSGVVYDISDDIKREAQLKSLSELFEFIRIYEKTNPDAMIFEFLEYINLTLESGDSPIIHDDNDFNRNAVNIITVHSSKGLEFPIVFVPHLVRNGFPSMRMSESLPVPVGLIKEELSSGDEHIQEERRLFYVALTRAKYKIYLTAASKYGEGKRKSKVSPFVVEVFGEKEVLDRLASPSQYDIKFIAEVHIPKDTEARPLTSLSKLSYTQIQTYRSCPRKYWYRYVLKVPSSQSSTLTYGNIIHRTLQEFYTIYRDGKNLDKSVLLGLYEDNWKTTSDMNREEEQVFKSRGTKSLTNFYDNLYNTSENPIYLERKFNISIGGVKIVGQIDRIDSMGNGVTISKNEGIEIIDYKTGENKKKLDLNGDQIRQLAIYSIAAEQVFQVKASKLSLLFVDLGEKVTAKSSRVEKMKEKVIEEIGEVARAIISRDFKALPGFGCRYCDYNKICKYAKQ